MTDLLPCPFCGGVAKMRGAAPHHAPEQWVECSQCKSTSDTSSGADRAAEKWNARTVGFRVDAQCALEQSVDARMHSATLAEKLSRIVLQMQRTKDWRLSEGEAETIVGTAKWLLALSASPSPAPSSWQPGQTLRKLIWLETFTDRGDGSKEQDGWEADSGFGSYYSVEQYFGSDSFGWQVKFEYEVIADHDDPDRAKQAAQADFERRALALPSTEREAGK